METKCIRCGDPVYRHPQTGKVYKLCAVCGLKVICQLLGLEFDEATGLIIESKEIRRDSIVKGD